MIGEYLLYAAVVFGLNLLPAFTPPTILVVAYFRAQFEFASVPMILLGALAAVAGRITLALIARRFRHRLSPRRLASLSAAHEALERRGGRLGRRAIFFVAPIPSGALFMAAGLMSVSLREPGIAFFLGRCVTHSLYVLGAAAFAGPLKWMFGGGFGSPLGIALEILTLAGFVVWLRHDWTRGPGAPPTARPPVGDAS